MDKELDNVLAKKKN